MKIISFAHTTPAMLAGHKTVTRREWDDAYGSRFRAGELVGAYNRSPRVHGWRVAVIRLTEQPRPEPLSAMPDSDYEGEGFGWMQAHPSSTPKTLWGEPFDATSLSRERFARWQQSGETMWVVRFELVQVDAEGFAKLPAVQQVLIADTLAPAVRHLYERAAVPA